MRRCFVAGVRGRTRKSWRRRQASAVRRRIFGRWGVPIPRTWSGACQCRRWWKAAQHPAVKEGMHVAWFHAQGLWSLTQQFESLQFSGNRCIRCVRTVVWEDGARECLSYPILEFYPVAFRKKLYRTLEELQATWIRECGSTASSGPIKTAGATGRL